MPPVHHETLQVRYWMCNALGQLSSTNYFRWMQEAAFGASAAVGYDWPRYRDMGFVWLARETDIRYLRPLKYGDEVDLRTWVLDFRRFRSRRAYEFTLARSGELAARAVTDWVYINAETWQPALVPEDMQRAYLADDPPARVPPRERFPAPPTPPPDVFTITRQVEWHDIDMMWHVNNAVYLTYIEEAGVRLAEAHGWSAERMTEEKSAILTRRHRIEYRQAARMGDELEISTWYSEAKRASALRHCLIRRAEDGELLVQAQVHCAWIDLTTGRCKREIDFH
ncbi:MAG: thioesterase [Dehalococcoidia bacterium]|nr:thioesterase [Dehalococcoidia bacterium]